MFTISNKKFREDFGLAMNMSPQDEVENRLIELRNKIEDEYTREDATEKDKDICRQQMNEIDLVLNSEN